VRKTVLLLVVLFSFLFVLWNARKSEALPVYARKYKTSCQTCHTAVPRLNPFGEAFRMNGHQWPGGVADEQEHSKDEPVELGAEAYKRVFPDAVWPSTIPGFPPISMIAENGLTYVKGEDGGRSVTSFNQPTFELQAGGNFGDNLTFFIAGPLFEDGSIANADLDHFFLEFCNLFSGKLPNNFLYLRVGKFAPELTYFESTHNEFTLTPFAMGFYSPEDGSSLGLGEKPAAGNGILGASAEDSPIAAADLRVMEPRMGIQINGLVQKRFRYVLGLQNDGSPENTSGIKNFYGRAVYKFGGMAYDGSEAAQTEHPYQEKSLAAGVFGYRGDTPNDLETGPGDLSATRVGGELVGTLQNLVLFGGYLHGQDETLLASDATDHTNFHSWYVQGEYVVFPWLIGVLRYEEAKAEGLDAARQIVPNVTTLYRANVVFRLEAPMNPDDLKLDTLLATVTFAY